MDNNVRDLLDEKLDTDSSLLSCIVVTYKQKNYLTETIDSVIMQDYPSIELIVADDGTEGFDKIAIEQYIDKNNIKGNIVSYKIIHNNENIGTVRNINSALMQSKGQYIKIIGGDDLYPSSDVFTRQIDVLMSNEDKLLVIGKTQECDHDMIPIHNKRVEAGNDALHDIFNMSYVEARKIIFRKDIFPIVCQAICFRRDFFNQFGLCDERYTVIDDAPTAIKILKCADKVVVINKFCVNHRSNVGISTSREFFATRRLKYYKDCAIYAEIEIAPYPEIFGPIHCLEIPRFSWFVFYMSLSKTSNEARVKRIILCLKYLDSIAYYVITRPKKLYSRIEKRVIKS